VASEDITIDGVFIPKGMQVSVPTYALQNDPEYWPHPERFDPDRYINKISSVSTRVLVSCTGYLPSTGHMYHTRSIHMYHTCVCSIIDAIIRYST